MGPEVAPRFWHWDLRHRATASWRWWRQRLPPVRTVTDVPGAWRAQPEERVTLDLGVRGLSPTMGVKIIKQTPRNPSNLNPKSCMSTDGANANLAF